MIALVAGIAIAIPIPRTSLKVITHMNESTSGVNRGADMRTPAIAIARLDPILAINKPPAKRLMVMTIIVEETSKLTELLPIS